uniref:At2g24240-like C-terminal beta-propeller domain-containing protein n=1 Tax=Ananas comosus var. bracteatus TaxID=296719 RepID=A0A6V7NJC1_ANACO|nr:unnamed protein product [Ananas comosus var. bracteatus]
MGLRAWLFALRPTQGPNSRVFAILGRGLSWGPISVDWAAVRETSSHSCYGPSQIQTSLGGLPVPGSATGGPLLLGPPSTPPGLPLPLPLGPSLPGLGNSLGGLLPHGPPDDLGFIDLRTSVAAAVAVAAAVRWSSRSKLTKRKVAASSAATAAEKSCFPKFAMHNGQPFSSMNDSISVFYGPEFVLTSTLRRSYGGPICDFSIGGDRLFALHNEENMLHGPSPKPLGLPLPLGPSPGLGNPTGSLFPLGPPLPGFLHGPSLPGPGDYVGCPTTSPLDFNSGSLLPPPLDPPGLFDDLSGPFGSDEATPLEGPRTSAQLSNSTSESVLGRAISRKARLLKGGSVRFESAQRKWTDHKVKSKAALCGVTISDVEAARLRILLQADA